MIKGVLEYHKKAHFRNDRSEYREVVEILSWYGLSVEEVVGAKTGTQKLKRAQVQALKQQLARKWYMASTTRQYPTEAHVHIGD